MDVALVRFAPQTSPFWSLKRRSTFEKRCLAKRLMTSISLNFTDDKGAYSPIIEFQ